jgi:hypothetical protein
MKKLEIDIAKLTARRALLDSKRDTARSTLDDAVAAQQKFLLEGDINDVQFAKKVQAAIDNASSELAGFDGAIATLAASISESERALAAELKTIASEADAKALASIIAKIDSKVVPWVGMTRSIVSDLESLNNVNCTSDPLAAFLRHISDQIEMGLRSTLNELALSVPQVAAGTMKIKLGAQPTAPARKVVAPPPTTKAFATKNVCWTDGEGKLQSAGKYNTVNLPPTTAARALANGTVQEIGSEVWKSWGNTKALSTPPISECTSLDERGILKIVEPNDPQFQRIDRGPPVILHLPKGA